MLGRPCELCLGIVPLSYRQSVLPEERSPQIAQMCLVKDAIFPEGWAGTLRTPLRPSGGLMSSLLLTGFMGELSCKRMSQDRSALGSWRWARVSAGLPATPLCTASLRPHSYGTAGLASLQQGSALCTALRGPLPANSGQCGVPETSHKQGSHVSVPSRRPLMLHHPPRSPCHLTPAMGSGHMRAQVLWAPPLPR